MKIVFHCLGTSNCRILEDNLKTSIKNLNIKEKIIVNSDTKKMKDEGIKKVPALEINGKVISQGRLLCVEDIENILKENMK